MRQIIKYSDLLCNNEFLLWFLMDNFPEGINTETDESIIEIMEENITLDKEWIDELTGYYDGIFDDNDGYLNNPKTIQLLLSTGEHLFIEFHAGDTLYFIDENAIGSTGASYSIKKIFLSEFLNYTKELNNLEKLLLLPMVKVTLSEKDEFYTLFKLILQDVDLKSCNMQDIFKCVFENCLDVATSIQKH